MRPGAALRRGSAATDGSVFVAALFGSLCVLHRTRIWHRLRDED